MLPKCYRCGHQPCVCKDGITLYHADCREVLPLLEAGSVDLVLTDPPYGISDKWVGGSGRGWGRSDAEKGVRNVWDSAPPDGWTIKAVIDAAPASIVWGGNYFNLPPSRCWLIWNKPERGFTLAEAEMAWTNADSVVRVFDHRRHESGRLHPTQKPSALFRWCLQQSWTKDAGIILDPFAGSGTTLRAAKDLGRRCIGIEIEERYCEIAANRLRQGVLL